MTLAEKLLKDFEELPQEKKKEVIDFVDFLKQKTQREMEQIMDNIIDNNKVALRELSK